MWILYVIGYLIMAVITTVIVKVVDDRFSSDLDDETPFIIGIFWIATLPFMILLSIGYGLYLLTEYLAYLIEEKLDESKNNDSSPNDSEHRRGGYCD